MTSKQFITLIVVLIVLGGTIAGLIVLQPKVQQVVERKTLGASPGPDIFSPYFSIDGVKNQYSSVGARPYSSTTCTYRVQATSTVQLASFSANQMASSTMVEIGVGATAFATTTSLGKATLQTGGGTLVSSTTRQTVVPGDYINVKVGMNGSGDALPKINGTCKVILTEI